MNLHRCFHPNATSVARRQMSLDQVHGFVEDVLSGDVQGEDNEGAGGGVGEALLVLLPVGDHPRGWGVAYLGLFQAREDAEASVRQVEGYLEGGKLLKD